MGTSREEYTPAESEPRVRDEFALRVEAEMARAPGRCALIIGDIEEFKEYNDEYGHPAGDRRLELVHSIIGAHIRQTDDADGSERTADIFAEGWVHHPHGDEWAVLLCDVTAPEGVDKVIGRLQRALAAHGIGMAMGGRLHIPGENVDDFFGAVDKLMYRNKHERILAQCPLSSEQEAELLAALAIIRRITGFGPRRAQKLLDALQRAREQQVDDGTYRPLGTTGIAGYASDDAA